MINEILNQIRQDDMIFYALMALLVLLIILFLIMILRVVFRQRPNELNDISKTQNQLIGALEILSDNQIRSQNQLLSHVEERFAKTQKMMTDSLGFNTQRTSQSLGALMQRLDNIDKAQNNIEKLSGDVLGLQDILSNKQKRGNFGEIQLYDIVSTSFSPDQYQKQAQLPNGTRADILIQLPNPPGAIVIDSKFPLEAYEALTRASNEAEKRSAQTFFRNSLLKHIKDISEKYIIDGVTSDGAMMFLPSEAVYGELYANFSDIVRKSLQARVWIVSPTTCMATLTTMRAVMKDVRLKEQAGALRKELGMLKDDMRRVAERVDNLDRHFQQASKDIDDIKISAQKVTMRTARIDNLEFDNEN